MKLSAIPDVRKAVDEAFGFTMAQHMGEILPFAEWLVREIRPHHVIEIGSLHGGTTWLWCQLATGKVISIDLPDGRFGAKDHHLNEWGMRLRNARLKDKCPRFDGVLGDSKLSAVLTTASWLLNKDDYRGTGKYNLACMAFIDGDHTYDGVKADYMNMRKFVRPGGVIVFHDIADTEEHRRAGCEVDKFWRELQGDKLEFIQPGAPWGGIGVLRV